jgi:NAD(P)-dependent dehydrogenase (short-subunit alcohol dehydrogenase family)
LFFHAIQKDQHAEIHERGQSGIIFSAVLHLNDDHATSFAHRPPAIRQQLDARCVGFSLYGGAKAAVPAFARSWSNDLKDRKIRVNSLSPAVIETGVDLSVDGGFGQV